MITNDMIISLPEKSTSVLDRQRKNIAKMISLTPGLLFQSQSITDSQFKKLSNFIFSELRKYNICDLSASNVAFKNLLNKLHLDCGKATVSISPYQLRYSEDSDKKFVTLIMQLPFSYE